MRGESRYEVSENVACLVVKIAISSSLRLAIDKVACKKQDSLIVQLFLNGYFYSKQNW